MPFEKNRKRHSLKIPIPGETQYAFYIWVTDEITFVRQDGIRQEIRLSMRNAPGQTTRTVTKDDVEVGGNSPIKVETITKATHKETQGIRQEADWSFLTDPQTHLKTHDVTIKARKSDGTENANFTLKLRKIDQFYVKETQGVGQEAYWTLDHRDDEGQIDFAHPDAVYNKDHGALRLDWFQNVVKSDPLYMLVLYGGNKIAAVRMSDITKATFPVAFNKTLTSSWDSYGADAITCQLRFGPKAHIVGMNLKIDADGTVSTPANYGQAYYYNTAYSLLQNATQAGETRFDTFFNGTASVFYTSLGYRYRIDQTNGAISSDGVQIDVDYAPPTAISDTGQYYSGARVNAYAHDVYFGWGYITSSQSSSILADVNSGPFYSVGYSYSSGPGASQFHTTKVQLSSNVEPWSWGGGGSETFPRMIYSNDGKVDKITLKFETATYSTSGFTEPQLIEGPMWGAQAGSSTLSFLGLSGSFSYSRASGPFPGAPPDPVWSTSGLASIRDYYSLTNFAIGEDIDDMWLTIETFTGFENETTTVSQTPYETFTVNSPQDERLEDAFVCNGKHYLSMVRRGEWEDYQQFFYLDRVDVTSKFHALIGGSGVFVDHIILDVKLSDIKKLK